MPDCKEVFGKGDDADKAYFKNVFDQLINLWQDNDKMREIMLDERIGKMGAQLAGVGGIRIWYDPALVKKPWANPTSFHLDKPYCNRPHFFVTNQNRHLLITPDGYTSRGEAVINNTPFKRFGNPDELVGTLF